MSKISFAMAQAAAGAVGEALAIEDVFSTYLYKGNDSTQTITNGIDLAGEGGLVWVKNRGFTFGGTTGITDSHMLVDTERGSSVRLLSNTTDGNVSATNYFSSFNSDGFTVGTNMSNGFNSGHAYASWTFRKAPRFFDVVTWTGDGTSSRQITHNLGVVPGCVIVKTTNVTGNWETYHRGLNNGVAPEDYKIWLNTTGGQVGVTGAWANTAPTDSVFYVNGTANTNDSGKSYVAYLFAHDPLGPSGDGSDGLIACGSYTGNGQGYLAGGNTINIGWEPQWVMIFPATVSGYGATIFDDMRGMVEGNVSEDFFLQPSSSAGEASYSAYIAPTSTGFKLETGGGYVNENGQTYIYMAIRRGPMRAPTSGTEVFAVDTRKSYSGGYAFESGFPVDLSIFTTRSGTTFHQVHDRIRRITDLYTQNTDAESGPANRRNFSFNNGYFASPSVNTDQLSWMFRRAPSFFDMVAYTGQSSSGRQKTHNLGVAPELLIVKSRSNIQAWSVLCTLNGGLQGRLNETSALGSPSAAVWGNGSSYVPPTEGIFTVGTDNETNATGWTYIAYLFATRTGVSKVGSYTGNGASQTIGCDFTTGARFVLIKRTDNTGDWYVWDTARGIVAGNDPHLSLNTTAAEVTTNDSIDPDNSGFIVNQVAATNINVNAATYIYLAIA